MSQATNTVCLKNRQKEEETDDSRMKDALGSQRLSIKSQQDWQDGNPECPEPETQGVLAPDGTTLHQWSPAKKKDGEIQVDLNQPGRMSEQFKGRSFIAADRATAPEQLVEGTFCTKPGPHTAADMLVLKRNGKTEAYKMVYRLQK